MKIAAKIKAITTAFTMINGANPNGVVGVVNCMVIWCVLNWVVYHT